MGSFSLWHWIIVLLIVVLLFGRGRIAEIMGDFGKGVKSFKQGISDEETKPASPPAQLPTANGESAGVTETTKTDAS